MMKEETLNLESQKAFLKCGVQVKHVAVDSSGLGIRRRSTWYSIRTHFSPSKRRDFRKLHLASECRQKEKPIYSWIPYICPET